MAKTREQKEKLLTSYKEDLKKVKSIILTSFSGLKSKNLFELKDQLYEKGIDYKVVKNRILGLALKEQGIEIPEEYMDKPLALAFSFEDEIEPAKIIYNFARENENLEILGGIQDKKFLQAVDVQALALLPGKEELYARIIGAINAPAYRLINALTQNQTKLVYILKNYLDSKN